MSVVISGSAKGRIGKGTNLEIMGLGMELRARPKNYKEIIGVPRSIYYQTNYITGSSVEKSIGMPQNSSQNIYTRISGTSGSAIQVSSTSANDTSAGTGAQSIYIEGLYIDSEGNWKPRSTFSSPTTLNGQTAVQIGTDTDWYRINKVWVLTAGSSENNEGDLYISTNGQALTAGVPDDNTLQAVIAGYGNSTGGWFSVGTNQRFNYTKGNFYTGALSSIEYHEVFYQDFNGSGNTTDMVKYEVGRYGGLSLTTSYDYTGSAPYTEKSDIGVFVTSTGGADVTAPSTYYVEYVITDATKDNI